MIFSGNNLSPQEMGNILGISIQGVYKILKKQKIDTLASTNRRKYIPPLGVRRLLEDRGFIYPKKNISFQIVKGGVGKTSLSFSLALRASHYGVKILVIDFDQQSNLTRSFGINARELPVWINLFRDNVKPSDAIVNVTENLDIIPSNLNNSRLDLELAQAPANLRELINDKIDPIRDKYDLVIMDCPPAINKINTAVSCSSNLIIIPLNPDPYAMEGLDFTLNELRKLKKEFKLKFDYKIIWNRYDARERLGPIYMHQLSKDENKIHHILPFVIRTDTALKNAIYDATSIFDNGKKMGIKEDIDHFTKELLGINAWHEAKSYNLHGALTQ